MTRLIESFFGVTVNGASPVRIPKSRRDLPALFAAAGFTRGAEIGVWEGEYSEVLARGIPGVHLLCVDPWTAYQSYKDKKNHQGRLTAARSTAEHRLRELPCEILAVTSREAARLVPDRSLDFVYLDGNHGEAFVYADLKRWTPKIRPGGVLAGHDFEHAKKHDFIQVQQAVERYVREHAITPWFLLTGDKAASFLWVVN